MAKKVKNFLNHVAIYNDGNRRWAKKNGLSPLEGHRVGFIKVAPKVLEILFARNIHTVSYWCFSTPNWKRDKDEVANLMLVFDSMMKIILKQSQQTKTKVLHQGRKDRIPKFLRNTIEQCEEETKNNTEHVFNLCLDYSGRYEIVQATQRLLAERNISEITEQILEKYFTWSKQPHPAPDLIIRTSGEQRTSGFCPWYQSYSEFYFPQEYFPEMNEQCIDQAIEEFYKRKRTFSG